MVCSLHITLLREEMEDCIIFDTKKGGNNNNNKPTKLFCKMGKMFLSEIEGVQSAQ